MGDGDRCQHTGAAAVAVAAIGIGSAGQLGVRLGIVAVGGRIRRGNAVVLVLVVAHMRATGFMRAVRRHGRPAELQGQQGEKNDGEPAAHGARVYPRRPFSPIRQWMKCSLATTGADSTKG